MLQKILIEKVWTWYAIHFTHQPNGKEQKKKKKNIRQKKKKKKKKKYPAVLMLVWLQNSNSDIQLPNVSWFDSTS